MLTTIKFIGLIVTTLLNPPNPPGAQLIMGDFPVSVPPHLRIIAYQQGSRINPDIEWPKVGSFNSGGTTYDYVAVTLENITITGPTSAFDNQMGAIPHLTCCCSAFTNGFSPAWGDPNAALDIKKSAYFTFNNGTYTTVEESTKAISTVLLIADNVNITFTGQLGAVTKTLVIRPFSNIMVANEPLAVLEGSTVHAAAVDFTNYYLMGIGTQDCTSIPSGGPPCAPQTASCPAATPELRSTAMKRSTKAVKKPKLSAAKRKRLNSMLELMVDVNCSSSAWP